MDGAEVAHRGGLAGPVAAAAGGVGGMRVHRQRVGEVAGDEVRRQDGGQAHGVAGRSMLCGVRADRHEGGLLGLQPGQRGRSIHRDRFGRGLAVGRVQRSGGLRCHGQVVVEQRDHGGPPGRLRVLGAAAVRGVGAQQVVHPVASRAADLDEVRSHQHVQHPLRVRAAGAGQGGDGGQAQLPRWLRAEQAEQPRGVGRQVVVGPGEHRPHRGSWIAPGVEQVEPAVPVVEFGDQLGQRARRAARGVLGRHPQRQR